MNRTALLFSSTVSERFSTEAVTGALVLVTTGPNIAIMGARNSSTYARPMPMVMESTAAKRLRMTVSVANRGRHVATVESPEAAIGMPTSVKASLHSSTKCQCFAWILLYRVCHAMLCAESLCKSPNKQVPTAAVQEDVRALLCSIHTGGVSLQAGELQMPVLPCKTSPGFSEPFRSLGMHVALTQMNAEVHAKAHQARDAHALDGA